MKAWSATERPTYRDVSYAAMTLLERENYERLCFAVPFLSGQSVLNVGCGQGYGASFLAEHGANSVIGIDASLPTLLDAARQHRRENLAFAAMDATCLGFPNDRFDVVLSFEVVEHVADPEGFVSEIYRVLKGGGVFILSTPNGAVSSVSGRNPNNPWHKKEFSHDELQDLLTSRFIEVQLFGQRQLSLGEFLIRRAWKYLSLLDVLHVLERTLSLFRVNYTIRTTIERLFRRKANTRGVSRSETEGVEARPNKELLQTAFTPPLLGGKQPRHLRFLAIARKPTERQG